MIALPAALRTNARVHHLDSVVSAGTPTSSRLRRTGRLGWLVAVQGGRIAGGRALDRVRSDEGRDRAQAARTADVVEQIVVQLGKMKGAAMKIGQVISTVEFPGMEAEAGERIQRRLAGFATPHRASSCAGSRS